MIAGISRERFSLNSRLFRYFLYFVVSYAILRNVGSGYLWYTDSYYYIGNDLSFLYLWNSNFLGTFTINYLPQLPFNLYILLMNFCFGALASKLIFLFSFFFLMTSVDYISDNLIMKGAGSWLLVSLSLFSIFNSLIIEYLIIGGYLIIYLITIFLWQFYFVCKLMEGRTPIYLVMASVLNIFFGHFVVALIFQSVLILFVLYISLIRKQLFSNIKSILFPYILLSSFICSFAIVPLLQCILHSDSSNIIGTTFKAGSDDTILNSYSPYQNLLRIPYLLGYYDTSDNIYFNNFSRFLFTFLIIGIFTYFLSRGSSRHKDGLSILFSFWTLIYILCTFLAFGPNGAFGFLFKWFWSHFPLFHIFRSTIRFIIPIYISYLFLMAITIKNAHLINPRYARMLAIIIICINCLVAYPLLTGNANNAIRATDIPSDYWDIRNSYFEEASQFKILVLPAPFYQFYGWYNNYINPYSAPIFNFESQDFYIKPAIMNAIGLDLLHSYTTSINDIYRQVHYSNTNLKSDILGLFNIKYIILHKDYVDWDLGKKFNPYPKNVVRKILNKFPNEEKTEFSNFYLIKLNNTMPIIYASTDPIIISRLDDFYPTASMQWFNPQKEIIIISDQNNKKIPQSESFDNPIDSFEQAVSNFFLLHDRKGLALNDMISKKNLSISPKVYFKKLNPTKYDVWIENITEPFWLVFSESFNENWNAYVDSKPISGNPLIDYRDIEVTEYSPESEVLNINDLLKLFLNPLPSRSHFNVNGYANAWYIDPKELSLKNSLSLTLYFKPQLFLILGIIMTLLTCTVCISYIIWQFGKYHVSKYHRA